MARLNELNTERRLRRGARGPYMTFEEFVSSGGMTREALRATDFEEEPIRDVTINITRFNQIWDEARQGTNGIKPAGPNASEFYHRLVRGLGLNG